jgi:hypothetical protein
MRSWRSKILVLVVAAVGAATARADMVSVCRPSPARREIPTVAHPGSIPPGDSLNRVLDLCGTVSLGLLPGEGLPGADREVELPFGTESVRLVTDGQSSLSLFLCGLMSFGVFRCGGWVKKTSFTGSVPDWYHASGPWQIGHSFATGPDLQLTPAYCFVQPERPKVNCLSLNHRGIIASFWRRSQFTPAVLASRGPPRFPF